MQMPIWQRMSQHIWFEHFKDKLQGLTEAFEKSGTSLSLLGFAIKEGHLHSEDYLKWAMSYYHLPLLQTNFFAETAAGAEVFAKWSTHYPWSAEYLPIAEWEGSLIVAGLQPPQDFPAFPQSIFILASFENLEKAWNSLHSQTVAVDSPSISKSILAPLPNEIPQGVDLSLVSTQNKSEDLFSFENLEVKENTSENIETSEEHESAVLEGIFDNLTVTKLEAKTTSQPPPSVLSSEVTSVPVSVSAPTPPPTSPSVLNFPPQNKAASSTTEPPRSTPPPFEEKLSEPIPLAPRPASAAKQTSGPASHSSFALEKLKNKNSALLDERVKTTLHEMKSHFEKSMILTLDEHETQVAAFAWDEEFRDIKDTSTPVPLKTPSIFNIVAATAKPFHGYISLNEINEKFFEDWNHGLIPDHVTIAPIVIQDKLVGMIVGFAEKAAYNRTSLNLVEKLSANFAKGLQAA